MATNFPTSLDSLTNPTASDKLNSVTVPHASQHSTLNDAVEALEAKVGVDGSAVTTSHDYLIDKQSVVPYADASARTTAVPSPIEGQMSYLEDTNSVEVYDGSAWTAVGGGGKILQVVSTTKTDTFSASVTNSNFSSNVTGLEATITPSAATSKIMVTLHLVGSESNEATDFFIRLMRDSTPICIGDAAGSRAQASAGICQVGADTAGVATLMVTYLDSPATTSAITYGVQMTHRGSTANVYVNRTAGDPNSYTSPRFASTITVQEVSA